jgi:hypothetical protein
MLIGDCTLVIDMSVFLRGKASNPCCRSQNKARVSFAYLDPTGFSIGTPRATMNFRYRFKPNGSTSAAEARRFLEAATRPIKSDFTVE